MTVEVTTNHTFGQGASAVTRKRGDRVFGPEGDRLVQLGLGEYTSSEPVEPEDLEDLDTDVELSPEQLSEFFSDEDLTEDVWLEFGPDDPDTGEDH